MREAVWLLIFFVAVPIQAATIVEPVTGGTADIVVTGTSPTPTGFETFSLTGADFSFTGTANQLSQVYYCNLPGNFGTVSAIAICPVGWQILPVAADIADAVGLNISGNIAYQGVSDDYTTGPASGQHVMNTNPFDLTAPNYFAPNVTLSTTFSGAAAFIDPNFADGNFFIFRDSGVVTVDLVLRGNPETGFSYLMQSMHLDFTPVPEPAAALLLAGVLPVLLLRSRYSRRQN